MTLSLKKARVATAALATTASLALWAATGSAQNRAAGPFNAAQVEVGRAAYAANCQGCHTDNLSGSGEAVPACRPKRCSPSPAITPVPAMRFTSLLTRRP